MNSDNNTSRRQQPVTTTSGKQRQPTNKSTMKTTSAGVQRPAVGGGGGGSNKSSTGANMGTNREVIVAGRPTAQPALMRRAYVRFDDYLDLNEENMRRSCKRLMNHLYSESSSPSSSSSTVAAVAIAGATTTTRQSSVEDSKPTGAPIKPSMANNSNGGSRSGAKSKSSNTNISINYKTAAVQQQNKNQQNSTTTTTTTTTTTSATNGKSYLRSQYERRQQRQLELMSKMQLEPGKQANNNNADGANESRQQQQDLVAKSHELSKRRFFEKLERRESIRNLKLSTPSALPDGKSRQSAPNVKSCSLAKPSLQILKHGYDQSQTQPPEDDRQKSLGDDELMLKVYQSIVLRDNNLTATESIGCDASKDDTLGGLDGTQLVGTIATGNNELATELIGFYTPSPHSPLADGDQRQKQQQLIEFSAAQKQQEQAQLIQIRETSNEMDNNNSRCSELVAETSTEAANSAFEIEVPANLGTNSSQNPIDGFISSGLLIIKQVKAVATANSHLLQLETQRSTTYAVGTRSVEEPPTLSGRHKDEASTQLAANNKTKTPLDGDDDDSTDNKVEQIDGQHHFTGTMKESIIVGGCGANILSSSKSAAIVGDNHQQEQALSISLTISSENNHNTSNEINNAISPFEDFNPTTTGNGSEQGGGGESEESTLLSKSPTSKMAIEVGGSESNCAKDHETPEMRMLVGQSGGATKNSTNGDLLAPDEGKSFTYPHQIQSTAQAQQVVCLQTIITTKPAVRDVLPEANEINRREAVVSSSNTSEANTTDKVTVIPSKQVNEVYSIVLQQQSLTTDQGYSESNGYANSVPGEAEKIENNVNHDVSEVKLKSLDAAGGGNCMGEHNHHHNLIESFTASSKHHPSLTQKDSNSSSIEEDGGSSCSSSGFGASVSVTSSSDGSNSLADTMVVVSGSKRESGAIRRPNSLAVTPSRDGDPIYDSMHPRAWARNQNDVPVSNANEFPDYKQLVGPDQAYPSKGRLMLIENHNYASILSRRMDGRGETILCEPDDSFEGYANLPLVRNNQTKTPPNVEYATVRPNISLDSSDNIVSQNKTKANNSASDASLSGHSYSTTSGGFSALPPAKLTERSSGNNFNSFPADLNNESSADGSAKKISIFKKIGSLVSRTFTGQTTNVPPTPQAAVITTRSPHKINEFSSNVQSEEQVVSGCDTNGIERKPALVIEQQDDHSLDQQATDKKQQITEADLVILPPKHVNQRKLPDDHKQSPVASRHHHHHHHHHDDRLSRGKRHSRRMVRKTDSVISISSSPGSSEESPSSAASSTNVRTKHRGEHPKRSESLFEDLESLVSASPEQSPYGRHKSLRQSHQSTVVASSCQHQKATIQGRIEIDCVSPDRSQDEGLKIGQQSAIVASASKSSGPRSLLRIFSAISSSRNSESTPNLATTPTTPNGCYSPNCDQIISGQEACDLSLQPISGLWGFSSLVMGSGHASIAEITASEMSKANRKLQTKASAKFYGGGEEQKVAGSSVYSNLQPLAKGYHRHLSSCDQQQEQQHSLDKYQSLNLYQNLLRNYAKRRNRNRHGHHHSHNYYSHHQHHHHHSRSRHGHRPARCATNCGQQNCQASLSSCSEHSGTNQVRAVVWGQLIKINKSDGSQVIELQRSPGKSWGFFVARGAINNVKGIFISRMHDDVTSSSLTGLLSIGDRILAIDECPIEPDYDILRVNQMISKKSKILLKVKPFKG